MIKLQDISHSFGENRVFSNFSCTIEKNEKIILSASSGTGKSTLLKMILGFVLPEKGGIEIDGEQLNEDSISAIRSTISYISQQIPFPDTTVEEFIIDVLGYKVNSHITYSKKIVLGYFEEFGLGDDLIDSVATDLSGGEKQRVSLIIALMLNRPILLLDEVTSGLDAKLKEIVVEKLSHIDTTVVVVSHDKEWLDNENYKVLPLGEEV